jgi:hypothetical protein
MRYSYAILIIKQLIYFVQSRQATPQREMAPREKSTAGFFGGMGILASVVCLNIDIVCMKQMILITFIRAQPVDRRDLYVFSSFLFSSFFSFSTINLIS